MSTQKTVVAFIAGAAAGGVTALLLAPDRGENTRARIREGAQSLADKSTEAASNTKENVVDTAKQQAGAVKTAVEKGSQAYKKELDSAAK